MKEITQEIRQRIFALYWGQRVCTWENNKLGLIPVSSAYINDAGIYLELTSLKEITDEDAYYLADKYFWELIDSTYAEKVKWGRESAKELSSRAEYSDFLRSRGYALPAFGFSVDELVVAGVFKLIVGK